MTDWKQLLADLRARRDELLYAFVDNRIAKGDYKSEDREHYFQVMLASIEALEHRLDGGQTQ